MTYEILLDKAFEANLKVKKLPIKTGKGLINGNRIALANTLETSTEKACVLAEELGHYHTTVGNILNLSYTQNRKQERRARLWAYNEMFGLHGLIRAYEHGCTGSHEIADYLEVTEEFLKEAVEYYREKYGICKIMSNYTIYFIPHLAVMKMI